MINYVRQSAAGSKFDPLDVYVWSLTSFTPMFYITDSLPNAGVN